MGPKRAMSTKNSKYNLRLCLKVLQPIAMERALSAFCIDLNISRSHTVLNAVSGENKTKGFAYCKAAPLPLCYICIEIRDGVSDST